jgi:drug/metabolite transporter (DMT)-like permease
MLKSTQAGSVLLAAIACALADILLKKATFEGNLGAALRSPWLAMAIGLYLVQAYLFIIAFIGGSKLSIIGVLLTAFYAIIVLTVGVLLYNETLTRSQMIGVVLALGGVVLINWP